MNTHDRDNDRGTDLSLGDAEHHNDQQNRHEEPGVDDNPDMNVDAVSPDSLVTPKGGRGARRLNCLPLIIASDVIVLTVMSVTCTVYNRQQ